MSSYRGLIWSLVAIAGTATAATLAYRYVTRSARSDDDDDGNDASVAGGSAERRGTTGGNTSDATHVDNDGDDAYDSLSESEYDGAFALDDDDDARAVVDAQQSQQQMVLVAREGNLLLSVFGVVLMLLVTAVSLIVAWTSDDVPSPADLPMFAPLMWIAIGIFTAASVEVLSQSAITTPEIPVLETDKAVFPHDESDFELIRQHNGESLAAPATSAAPLKTDLTSSSAPARELPKALANIVKNADSLTASKKHREAREFLLGELAEHSEEVEVLWRLARAAYLVAQETADPEEKKALVLEGLTHAEKAHTVDANSATANSWLATVKRYCDKCNLGV